MLLLLLTLLFPTPAPDPESLPVGAWHLDGPVWSGWTVHLHPGGAYHATLGESLWVGEWSVSRGVLVVRERPAAGGCWQRREFGVVKVGGGRLTAGGLTGLRVPGE